jgi:hypothetical protein
MKYILALIFCLFMGVTAISFGGGALYPPINHVAQPFVCPAGKMAAQTTTRRGRNNKTYVETAWTCVEPSGKQTPINALSVALYAGSIYGFALFLPLAFLLFLSSRGRQAAQAG